MCTNHGLSWSLRTGLLLSGWLPAHARATEQPMMTQQIIHSTQSLSIGFFCFPSLYNGQCSHGFGKLTSSMEVLPTWQGLAAPLACGLLAWSDLHDVWQDSYPGRSSPGCLTSWDLTPSVWSHWIHLWHGEPSASGRAVPVAPQKGKHELQPCVWTNG